MDFGGRIKTLRIQKGLNQKQLAEQSGISPSYLCDIEKGRFVGSVEVLHRIATSLEVDISDLFKSKDNNIM